MKQYKFYKELNGNWYVDLPEWKGSKADLQMVAGADTMLDIIAQGENVAWLTISENPFVLEDTEPISTDAFKLTKIKEIPEIGGARYLLKEWYGIEYNLEMWLCEVTRFVFNGKLPEVIYIA